MRVLQEPFVAGAEEEDMNAERLAKIRATLLDYQSALVDAGASEAAPTVADAFCEVYVRDVGDLLAVMDVLSGPVVWHYKAGTDVNAVKAALANSDNVNIRCDPLPTDDIKKLTPKPGDLIVLQYEGGNSAKQRMAHLAADDLSRMLPDVRFMVLPRDITLVHVADPEGGNPVACDCSTETLMASGCQCGAMRTNSNRFR